MIITAIRFLIVLAMALMVHDVFVNVFFNTPIPQFTAGLAIPIALWMLLERLVFSCYLSSIGDTDE